MEYPERININDTTYVRADSISDMTKKVKPETVIREIEISCSGRTEWADYYNCPYCDAGWGSTIISSKFNFCPRCGVKIDRDYALQVRSAFNQALEDGIQLISGESGDELIERIKEQHK